MTLYLPLFLSLNSLTSLSVVPVASGGPVKYSSVAPPACSPPPQPAAPRKAAPASPAPPTLRKSLRDSPLGLPYFIRISLRPLLEQPLVVGVVLDLPLSNGTGHDVEVVEVVARRRSDHVVTLRHQHHIPVVERQGLVERAVFGIDPLQRETLLRPEPVIVGLLKVPLARGIVLVVLVRRIARPVAVRGQDLDHQKPLRRSVLHQDRTYLSLHVASAAYLDLDILGPDQHRIRPPLRRRRSYGDLQIRHGFYPVVRAWRQVECIGSAVEHALAAPDLRPLLNTSGYLTRSGERD